MFKRMEPVRATSWRLFSNPTVFPSELVDFMDSPPIADVRPLIALLTPMVALLGIAWAGEKRKNLREIFTLAAGVVQAVVVLSMIPKVLEGQVLEFHIWQIFTKSVA